MNGIYLGNILTAASVVFAGTTFSQFQSFANVMELQSMSERSFFALQKKYVYPTINFTYKSYQKCLIDESKSRQNMEVEMVGVTHLAIMQSTVPILSWTIHVSCNS